ncbi:hypothetical protein DFH28DRAFT_1122039 [Melampsora americana]|nr:hypothetical protein DFH28DRAFT_1122039 [Melampsora americana]
MSEQLSPHDNAQNDPVERPSGSIGSIDSDELSKHSRSIMTEPTAEFVNIPNEYPVSSFQALLMSRKESMSGPGMPPPISVNKRSAALLEEGSSSDRPQKRAMIESPEPTHRVKFRSRLNALTINTPAHSRFYSRTLSSKAGSDEGHRIEPATKGAMTVRAPFASRISTSSQRGPQVVGGGLRGPYINITNRHSITATTNASISPFEVVTTKDEFQGSKSLAMPGQTPISSAHRYEHSSEGSGSSALNSVNTIDSLQGSKPLATPVHTPINSTRRYEHSSGCSISSQFNSVNTKDRFQGLKPLTMPVQHSNSSARHYEHSSERVFSGNSMCPSCGCHAKIERFLQTIQTHVEGLEQLLPQSN